MLLTSPCCKSVSTTGPSCVMDDPFATMIVLDYYDGPAGGLLKCRFCGAEYYFYMLDWDDMHLTRVFALAQVPSSSFRRLVELFKSSPDRRVWIPPVLAHASEEAIEDLYERGIQDIITQAANPTIVMAWSVRVERALAIRGIDPVAEPHLRSWFDSQPHPVAFNWFDYLGIAKSLQPA